MARNLKKGEKVYLDGRYLVSGKSSQIHLDNALRLGLLPEGGLTNEVLTKASNIDYDVEWTDINTLISSIINPINIANTLFVAVNGNDLTALVGNIDLKFKTISAAITAASSGQTIIVFPGLYTEAINVSSTKLVKNNVTLYLYPNAVLSILLTGLTSSNVFYDNTFTSTINIKGKGNVQILSDIECILPLNYSFNLEVNDLIMQNCYFNTQDNFLEININANNISANSLLFIDGLGLSGGNRVMNIQANQIVQPLSTVTSSRFIEIKNSYNLIFTLKTNYLFYQRTNPIAGCFYLNKNFDTSNINIDISNVKCKDFGIVNALIVNNADASYKNIDITVDSRIPLISCLDSASGLITAPEKGLIKIKGNVSLDEYQAVEANKSIIDFNNLFSMLKYEFDLYVVYETDYVLFNLTAPANRQIISGSIQALNYNTITPLKPIIEYGRLIVGAATIGVEYPALKDLIVRSIASNLRNSFGKNAILGSNNLKTVNTCTNTPFDNTSFAVTTLIINPVTINALL